MSQQLFSEIKNYAANIMQHNYAGNIIFGNLLVGDRFGSSLVLFCLLCVFVYVCMFPCLAAVLVLIVVFCYMFKNASLSFLSQQVVRRGQGCSPSSWPWCRCSWSSSLSPSLSSSWSRSFRWPCEGSSCERVAIA